MNAGSETQNSMSPIGYYQRARSNRDRTDPVRVALYARVSTQHEEQVHALKAQQEWLESLCQFRPNWINMGMYVDEGISGTVAEKRDGFMRMLQEAKRGKV